MLYLALLGWYTYQVFTGKKQTTILFAVNDLAIIKARAKEMGMGYQNLIKKKMQLSLGVFLPFG